MTQIDEARERLAPCPFCGQIPTLYPDGDVEGHEVLCMTKDCTLVAARQYNTEADAIAAWNRRAAAPAAEPEPEAHGLPSYPEGDVVGPCVCGSWPGGKCLRCKVIVRPAAEPALVQAAQDMAYRCEVYLKAHPQDTAAVLQSRQLLDHAIAALRRVLGDE